MSKQADFPLYPSMKKSVDKEGYIEFSTLIRKRFDGKYYLLKKFLKGKNPDRVIHELHSSVYKVLMLSPLDSSWVLDKDQENEVLRLKKL